MNRLLNIFIVLSLGCLILTGCTTTGKMAVSSKSHPIKIALYSDKGTLPVCIEKSMEVLSQEKDMSIDKITQADIVGGKLDTYDIFLLPGGTANGERNSLGKDGCERVTEFAKNGKSVIATCAGAYLIAKGWSAATKDIELINAEVNDLDNWARGVQPVECTINSASPKLQGQVFKIHYENGPPLIPADLKLPVYTSLAKYKTDLHPKGAPEGQMSGKDAIIAAPFGRGKVLSFSSHPELTPGLEWMLVSAVHWAARHPKAPEQITWEKVFGNKAPAANYK